MGEEIQKVVTEYKHVCGQVQGTRRTTFCAIPSSRREHRLVSMRCATLLHVILAWSPH